MTPIRLTYARHKDKMSIMPKLGAARPDRQITLYACQICLVHRIGQGKGVQMDEGHKRRNDSKDLPAPGAKRQSGEVAEQNKDSSVWLRGDGAICFGNDCASLKPTESGKLKLTVKPNRCGEAIGTQLVDYLIKTAGKGVEIEIPSELIADDQESHK